MKNWIAQIDQTTKAFQNHFDGLSEEALNWKPNTTTWSIAQNIDHLITINETYFPVLADLKTGKYRTSFIGKFDFLTSLLGKMLLQSVQPTTKKKIKTFPIWEPAKGHLSANILDRFIKHQHQLKQEIESVKTFLQKGAVIASPANKYIVYKLETAFDIIVAHEQRHLEQAKEILLTFEKQV